MKIIFFNGDPDNFVAPSIVFDDTDLRAATRSTLLGRNTREFLTSRDYQLVTSDDLEVREMGEIGRGLFAKRAIPEGTVVAVCGGEVRRSNNSRGLSECYARVCTRESIGSANSFGAMYRYTTIFGDGSCAADLSQHAFDLGSLLRVLKQNNLSRADFTRIADPNLACEAVELEDEDYCDFAVDILRTSRDVAAGEILLNDYGEEYFYTGGKAVKRLALFDTFGNVIAWGTINRSSLHARSFLLEDLIMLPSVGAGTSAVFHDAYHKPESENRWSPCRSAWMGAVFRKSAKDPKDAPYETPSA